MKIPEKPVTLVEFRELAKAFFKECESGGGHLIHKKCGGGIRRGFMNLYYLTPNGELDPGNDGCGIGPVGVPYCENCDPPDGHNYTYSTRVPILRDSTLTA